MVAFSQSDFIKEMTMMKFNYDRLIIDKALRN